MTPQAILAIAMRIAEADDRAGRCALAQQVGALLLRLTGLRIKAKEYDAVTFEDPSIDATIALNRHSSHSMTMAELIALLDRQRPAASNAPATEGGAA